MEVAAALRGACGESNVRAGGELDTATCRSQLQSMHVAGEHHFVIGGFYDDRLVRTPQGWRIDHRVMQATWQTGTRP